MCPDAPVRDILTQLIDEETFIIKNERFTEGESTIFETCTSKNGKRVTEGAYALAWDEERAREGREQTRREVKEQNHHALPDSFLYESLGAR